MDAKFILLECSSHNSLDIKNSNKFIRIVYMYVQLQIHRDNKKVKNVLS